MAAQPVRRPAMRRPGRTELALAAVGLLALGALVFGPYVPRGGLYWDDWENAATTMHPPAGFLGPVDPRVLEFRPVLAVLLVLPALAGRHAAPQLALAALLTVGMVWCFYRALRTVGLSPWHAGPIAALALLFPYSGATRLWATGAVNNVAVALYLVGLCAGLRALDETGRRAARLRWAAIACQVAAILTYEVVAVAALGSIVLYAARAGRRAAWRQWRLEAPFLAAATLLNGIATPRHVGSISTTLAHAQTFAAQSLTLLARSLLPFDGVSGALVAAGAATAGLLTLVAHRRLAPDDPRRAMLGRGWALCGAGAMVVAAGYAMFVPGTADYAPLHPGTRDRVNLLAALGFAIVAYGAALALGGLAGSGLPRRARWAPGAVTAAACTALAGGYLAATLHSERLWERASVLQHAVLAPLERARPRLRPGSTVYTVGHRRTAAAGVPVFERPWDLNGAIKVATGDPSLSAYPLGRRARLTCAADRPGPAPVLVDVPAPPRYGAAFVLDVRSGRLAAIESPAGCRALNRRLQQGSGGM